MKQEAHLNRTNGRQITFMGELLINETTKEKKDSRWFRIQIYIVDWEDSVTKKVVTDGGYMIGIAHITSWKGERDQYWVEEPIRGTEAAANVRRVVNALRKHPPEAPTPEDNTEVARQKQEGIDEYLELVDWIAQEIKSDALEPKDESPGNNTGEDQTSMLSA